MTLIYRLRPNQEGVYPRGVSSTRPQSRTFDVWYRCDWCKWSGPVEKFHVLTNADVIAHLCIHVWCAGNALFVAGLKIDGWQFDA